MAIIKSLYTRINFTEKANLIELSICVDSANTENLLIRYIKDTEKTLREFEFCRKYCNLIRFLLHHRYFDDLDKLLTLKNILINLETVFTI